MASERTRRRDKIFDQTVFVFSNPGLLQFFDHIVLFFGRTYSHVRWFCVVQGLLFPKDCCVIILRCLRFFLWLRASTLSHMFTLMLCLKYFWYRLMAFVCAIIIEGRKTKSESQCWPCGPVSHLQRFSLKSWLTMKIWYLIVNQGSQLQFWSDIVILEELKPCGYR